MIQMTEKLLPTTVVGSYTQPEWLIDRENLTTRLPPRVRVQEIWRIPPEFLEAAQDDATLLAIRDMERAGIDIISDGEVRRESYSNRVATAPGRHRHREPRLCERPLGPGQSRPSRDGENPSPPAHRGERRGVFCAPTRTGGSRLPCRGRSP